MEENKQVEEPLKVELSTEEIKAQQDAYEARIKKKTFELISGIARQRANMKQQLSSSSRLRSHPADKFVDWSEDEIWNEYRKIHDKNSTLSYAMRSFIITSVIHAFNDILVEDSKNND